MDRVCNDSMDRDGNDLMDRDGNDSMDREDGKMEVVIAEVPFKKLALAMDEIVASMPRSVPPQERDITRLPKTVPVRGRCQIMVEQELDVALADDISRRQEKRIRASDNDAPRRWLLSLEAATDDDDATQLLLVRIPASQSDGAGTVLFHAVDAVCPHSGGPLHLGDIEDVLTDAGPVPCRDWEVTCPYHAYRFSLTTGRCSTDEQFNVSAYHCDVGPASTPTESSMTGTHVHTEDDMVVRISRRMTVAKDKIIDSRPRRVLNIVPYSTGTSMSHVPSILAEDGHLAERFESSCAIKEGDILTPSADMLTTPSTLVEWAVRVLNTADAELKVEYTFAAAHWWRSVRSETTDHAMLPIRSPNADDPMPPAVPPRVPSLMEVSPGLAPRRGRGGTAASRVALLHALANIEQWAIDLAWDMIARFGPKNHDVDGQPLPPDFFDDFVKVAVDEATHYRLLDERLREYDAHFGSLPVQHGLWESAQTTQHDVLARLAIVHMVHEARGLDVNPMTIEKFRRAGDEESVTRLERIHLDEVSHVAIGYRWFAYMCARRNINDPIGHFHTLVGQLFRGPLKPPFNEEDRLRAGLSPEWYLPLASSAKRND